MSIEVDLKTKIYIGLEGVIGKLYHSGEGPDDKNIIDLDDDFYVYLDKEDGDPVVVPLRDLFIGVMDDAVQASGENWHSDREADVARLRAVASRALEAAARIEVYARRENWSEESVPTLDCDLP